MFQELREVIKELRRKCPWDRKQTLHSTRPLLINEVYELEEAIRSKDPKAIKEELGDYLYLGFFLAYLLEEKEGIKLDEIIKGTINKLKSRHPHVYGNLKVKKVDDVLKNWEKIKNKNKKSSILNGIPPGLPALHQAQLLQERCRRVGFDWEKPEEVLKKVEEEIRELKREIASKGKKRKLGEELGDLLFALVNLCRHLGVDAEGALKDANKKFQKRFQKVEEMFQKEGRDISSVSLKEMDKKWVEVKKAGF